MVEELENNKRILREFADMMINQRRPEEAIKKYMGDRYIQHEPIVEDGPEGCLKFHQDMLKEYPNTRLEIKRMIAEDDLVVLHLHMIRYEGDRGAAVIDIFRLDNNKLVEHWNAVQEIPETSLNDNGVF